MNDWGDSGTDHLCERRAPLDIPSGEFRKLGHALVDQIAEFLDSLPRRPVTPGESPATIRHLLRDLLGSLEDGDRLPHEGAPAAQLLDETARLLFDHSLHNGHPRFMGYITSSAAPLGTLADLLAAAVNPNVGGWDLSPVASEIERQTIRWLAELIGYPSDCGGLMVSGGNLANLVGFFAARKAKTSWDVREAGLQADPRRLAVYASEETHTWIQKAADLSGIGTNAIRWIETDDQQQMVPEVLEQRIRADQNNGQLPFIVVGAAGTVSTGAIDPLPEIADICRKHDLWFHVDGAYGAPAAALPEAPQAIKGLGRADSVALDPHKWLYCPLEAGCTLVRDPQHLADAFSFLPDYYHFDRGEDDPGINYYEYGFQNSRGFRALKVWLGLRQVGRDGSVAMIRDDIALAQKLYELAENHGELEAYTHNLSITTFRYVPADLPDDEQSLFETYLNELNQQILTSLQKEGEIFVSNAIIDGKYTLRACIVNFRTSLPDIEAVPGIVVRTGQRLDRELRPTRLG